MRRKHIPKIRGFELLASDIRQRDSEAIRECELPSVGMACGRLQEGISLKYLLDADCVLSRLLKRILRRSIGSSLRWPD